MANGGWQNSIFLGFFICLCVACLLVKYLSFATNPLSICSFSLFGPPVPMARVVLLASLLLYCCLLSCPNTTQARHLREFISSQRKHGSLRKTSWTLSHQRLSEVYVAPQDGLMEADKIVSLPGQPQGVAFDQYSGYVTVDPSAGRALFYYFVESPQNHTTKPLVLWLNGGPGCSSLGGGAMVELGPFRVNSDGKTLQFNDYSWNRVANVIFLESPAGVGFSYSNTTSDYDRSGDEQTATDAYTFLVNWLERFPQYKNRDFYITGESYAGHYVPELASTILAHNNSTNETIINLKGIAMGNADVDDNIRRKGVYEYYWTHALISDETHAAIESKCNFTSGDYSSDCTDALNTADGEKGNINIFNIYAPHCFGSSRTGSFSTRSLLKGVDPCLPDYANNYLNLPEVQGALHANVTGLPYPWRDCSKTINDKWTDSLATTLPMIEDLIKSGIRTLIYSGDQDADVPVTSTRYSLNMLDLSIEASWKPWYIEGEVGGYVVEYKGLTFATVRGAGHMVPQYQPHRALTLISSFLKGNYLLSK